MTERLLHYIWQHQYFNAQQLTTTTGEALQVIHPGTYNLNQGPDFLNAKICIGNITWVGNIELHVAASEWETHGHSTDPNYDNVVLHVVWKQDRAETKWPFATLELKERIPRLLLSRYESLMQNTSFIACENEISKVPPIIVTAWKERMTIERLQQKTAQISELLLQNNQHWEETCWWMLARNFGAVVNSATFETIARSLPLTLLIKHRHHLLQVEALLFGQAQLLSREFKEEYPRKLKNEYGFLKKKYGFKKLYAPLFFLRMRPANFPTIRLAQLAKLITSRVNLFSLIRETESLDELKQKLDITADDYWADHYTFENESAAKEKRLGQQMLQNILINTVVPLLFAYGHLNANENTKAKALQWLQEIDPEENRIIRAFARTGITCENAADSQALIFMKKQYCEERRCLQCAIGNKIMNNE